MTTLTRHLLVIPVVSAICSFALIVVSTKETKIRLSVWLLIGIIVYFAYGKRKSKLQRHLRAQRAEQAAPARELPLDESTPVSFRDKSKPSYRRL